MKCITVKGSVSILASTAHISWNNCLQYAEELPLAAVGTHQSPMIFGCGAEAQLSLP